MIKKYNLSNSPSFSSMKTLYGKDYYRSPKSVIELLNTSDDRLNIQNNRNNYNMAMKNFNLKELIKFSKFLYRSNLIYARLIDYFSSLLCYYWLVTPKINTLEDINKEELMKKWWECLDYIEIINPEKLFTEITKEVLIKGSCYVAVREKNHRNSAFGIQILPNEYCRVTRRYLGRDIVDFNLKFFDDYFSNKKDLELALESFPPCISEEYKKNSKSKNSTWITIDPNYGFRFSLRTDGMPYFVTLVMDLLDVQDIKDITMFKFERELSKIIVQKFGTDNEGNPIVDMDDLEKFQVDAAGMIQDVPGVDVLTTYADVTAIDLQSKDNGSNINPMENITKNVYNSAGVSKLLFNADNSGTLKQSLVSDESLIFILLKQYKEFLQTRIDVNYKKGVGKKFCFSITMPEITINNKLEMAKVYKEQTTLGFSKFLPGIVMGQRQSDILSMFLFENDVLNMVELMRPPITSNNMSREEQKSPGRESLKVDEISEKTAANKETL